MSCYHLSGGPGVPSAHNCGSLIRPMQLHCCHSVAQPRPSEWANSSKAKKHVYISCDRRARVARLAVGSQSQHRDLLPNRPVTFSRNSRQGSSVTVCSGAGLPPSPFSSAPNDPRRSLPSLALARPSPAVLAAALGRDCRVAVSCVVAQASARGAADGCRGRARRGGWLQPPGDGGHHYHQMCARSAAPAAFLPVAPHPSPCARTFVRDTTTRHLLIDV